MRTLYQANTVLQAIPLADRRSFTGDLERMEIRAHGVLSIGDGRLTDACFPTGAVISVLCRSNRKTIEVYGVGREGMLGPHVLFAAKRSHFDVVCQIGGSMLHMPSKVFERHMLTNSGLQRAISLNSVNAIRSLTQSVACNGLHSLAQRCARCLLMTVDRV